MVLITERQTRCFCLEERSIQTYGEQPSLDPQDLDRIGDLRHNIDFRSVYSTVLGNWLEVDPVPLIGEPWPLLPFL